MGKSSLYCQLDTTCTAAIIVRYILQCIVGNCTVVTRNTPSRANSTQFISLKAGQNIRTFLGKVPTACHVTPQNTFFVLLKWPAFRPALFWPDTVANQVSICWRLTAPLELPTAANIQFFECCMSAYRSPDFNDVLWPPKQLFRRHSATYT